jgi:hypothetical protein
MLLIDTPAIIGYGLIGWKRVPARFQAVGWRFVAIGRPTVRGVAKTVGGVDRRWTHRTGARVRVG